MKYYTVSEVAAILQIHERTIREYLRSGEMRGYKLGDVWRISEEDLQEFMEQRANRPRKATEQKNAEQAE